MCANKTDPVEHVLNTRLCEAITPQHNWSVSQITLVLFSQLTTALIDELNMGFTTKVSQNKHQRQSNHG